jgi:hypothetical protein
MKEIEIHDVEVGDISIADIVLSDDVFNENKDYSPEEITEECTQELSKQAQQIKSQEDKLSERMKFENDRAYYFSILFESSDQRQAFLNKHGLKLKADDYILYEDLKRLIKE